MDKLTGSELVMLYVVYGNQRAQAELHKRIKAQHDFEEDQAKRSIEAVGKRLGAK